MQTLLLALSALQIAGLAYLIYKFLGKQIKDVNSSVSIKSSSSSIQPTKKIVLDTSAVIDGRILALAEAGFLNGTELISTNLILDEMQYLADEGDSFKRSRARYGLEVLNGLRDLKQLTITTDNLDKTGLEVDQCLLNHAKDLGAQLFTADFNLAQRARAEGVEILSPNDLSESLKPQILPGESFTIKLIQKGDDRGQAVGYLPDGTMVVAENSQNKIGQSIELKSSKIIQTTAGRIVFAQQAKSGGRQSTPRSKSQNQAQDSKPAKEPKTQAKQPQATRATQKNRTQTRPNQARAQSNNRPNNLRVNPQEEALLKAINGE